MNIVLLAERFESGKWRHWRHWCDADEIDAVVDSASAKARDKANFGSPSPMDYLMGARYIFNVAYGLKDDPKDGDTQVYGLIVDQIMIAFHERFERHFVLLADSQSNPV